MHPREAEQLYRKFGGIALRRAREILRDETLAKDVLQDVFARVLKTEQALNELESPVSWLYQMTTRICLNHIRNEDRRTELYAEHGPKLERRAESTSDERLTVVQLLARVPEEQREIALYYFVDQMSHLEIAELVGVSRRTVGNRLDEFRASARAADVTLPQEMA